MIPLINGFMLAVSSSLAASIVAKATFTTALALTGVRLARKSRAAVRHALLAAAFGVLLALPIVSIVAPPVRIATPMMAQDRAWSAPTAGTLAVAPPITAADAGAGGVPVVPRRAGLSLPVLLLMGWIAGTTLFLLPMVMGLWQTRSLRRSARPWLHGQSVVEALAPQAGIHGRVEVLLHEAAPGPMTCGAVHPAIVFSRDAQSWDGEDLNRAMIHELEHVRRGDWMSHCLARAVCAVYWFHPLVWIAWRRLALEAERSCDDAVLGRAEATAYAEQLVGLARRLLLVAKVPVAKSSILAMANRADLSMRVKAVLDSGQPRGRAGAVPVALACAAAAVLVITMSPLRMVAAPQSASAQAAITPEFDAVSVKLVDPNMRGSHSHESNDPGRLTMSGTMHMFIVRAYGITNGQLGGEPDWFKNHLYSIVAVTSARASLNQMMLMLRHVLADRFQLKLRQEDRDMPVYALEVAAGGPKFKELKPGEDPLDATAPPDVFARSFTSMEDLTNTLNGVFGGRLTVDRPVVDRTHLTGSYNMQLWTEIETQTDGLGSRILQFPNLFHDMQSQLGLKVVPDHVRMPYFVVEGAAAPTAN
jgi:uncharacterized protein (TIGR03435 family)